MTVVARRVVALARWLVRLEIGIWRSLFFWITRRRPGAGPGVLEFSYAKEVTPILAAIIVVSAIEVPVVHLLLPWDTIRLAALVLGVWGLLWMLGYLAALRVFRHLVDDDGLRVRYGTTEDIRIPWQAIERVERRRGSAPTGKTVEVERGEDGAVLHVAVLKQTRVAVQLREPTTVHGEEGVTEVRLYADDPQGFVAAARDRIARRAVAVE